MIEPADIVKTIAIPPSIPVNEACAKGNKTLLILQLMENKQLEILAISVSD
jgi:hypothetical protein